MADVLQKPLIKSCDMSQEMQDHAVSSSQAVSNGYFLS